LFNQPAGQAFFSFQHRPDDVPARIIRHAGDQRRIKSATGKKNGLIGALASEVETRGPAQYGLSGQRKVRHGYRFIDSDIAGNKSAYSLT
jgi:hypothetical protein